MDIRCTVVTDVAVSSRAIAGIPNEITDVVYIEMEKAVCMYT
jgi:hypothetical protein